MKKWIAAMVFLPVNAFAQGYVGTQVGTTSINIDTSGASHVDDSDTSWKIFGGAPINDLFAAEFGWIDLGKYRAYYPAYGESDTAKATALYGAFVIRPKLSDVVRVIGKVGFARWDGDVSVSSTTYGAYGSGSDTGFDPMYGVGVEFAAARNLAIRAEFERYTNVLDGINVNVSGGVSGTITVQGEDVDVIGLSAIYSF